MVRERELYIETPRRILHYEDLSLSNNSTNSANNASQDTNCSLNSSNTNTSSTCSTTRHNNKRNNNNDILITNGGLSQQCHQTHNSQAAYDYGNPPVPTKSYQVETQEFLPICDALFNVICLVAYFCDIVFDVLAAYTFYSEGSVEWAVIAIVFIVLSMIISQVLSLKWYVANGKRGQEPPCSKSVLILMHMSLCGVLWRYFKLFIPVELRFVKGEVRDLCLLRLVHAFCEAAPMLIIQLYLICLKTSADQVTDLTIVSTALSLFSVCWALASFSKNIRRQNVHKLVLTWLGVIFQFLWRLGTVTSRVLALSVYATVYGNWVFLVIILHWFSMLMWLISPKNIFHGEKMSAVKKVGYSAVIAVVYVFCYINVQEVNSRQKVIIYYVTMFLENTLLLSVWLIAVREEDFWYKDMTISIVFAAFVVGLLFMSLYYRYFHVKKLSYAYESGASTPASHRDVRSASLVYGSNYYSTPSASHAETLPSPVPYLGKGLRADTNFSPSTESPGSVGNGNLNPMPQSQVSKEKGGRKPFYNKINGHHIHHPNVPGVFNCRFNPAMKRKKKKPSSFVPPPPPVIGAVEGELNSPQIGSPHFGSMNHNKSSPGPILPGNSHGRMNNPFWKRPLSITVCSENEGSITSRVDIHEKLQKKKQQQLAELKKIEEEIKQGKLVKPNKTDGYMPGPTSHQPAPFTKKQPWFRADPSGGQLSPRLPIIIPPSNPNELILDPHYLIYSSHEEVRPNAFYDQPDWANYYEPLYQNDVEDVDFSDLEDDDVVGESFMGEPSHARPSCSASRRKRRNVNSNSKDGIYKSYRIPSDIDSQMSLPRSYTLPREFKYKRKQRKIVKTETFLPSTNSSDGKI